MESPGKRFRVEVEVALEALLLTEGAPTAAAVGCPSESVPSGIRTRDEREDRGGSDGVSSAMPSLMEAHKLSARAAQVGFDWPNIDGLFATGVYSDIQVDVEPQAGGVVVKFITKSAPFVGHVEVTGRVSVPPSRGTLAGAMQLRLGTPFEEEALEAAGETVFQVGAIAEGPRGCTVKGSQGTWSAKGDWSATHNG